MHTSLPTISRKPIPSNAIALNAAKSGQVSTLTTPSSATHPVTQPTFGSQEDKKAKLNSLKRLITLFFSNIFRFILGLYNWLKRKGQNGVSRLTSGNTAPVRALQEDWPIGRLTTRQVFGAHPNQIRFRQNGGNTCYLLSGLDNILHHPKCNRILDQIGFEKTKDDYIVTFPGQREPVHVRQKDIRDDGVRSDNPGVRLLEAAYFKIPQNKGRWGEFDESANALSRMFREDDLEPFNIQNSRNTTGRVTDGDHEVVEWREEDGRMGRRELPPQLDHWIGQFGFTHSERSAQFKEFIRNAHNQETADILTAIRIGEPDIISVRHNDQEFTYEAPQGRHYYSLRLHQSTPDDIVLVDPFNTSEPFHVPFDQFMEEYNVEGMRLKLEPKKKERRPQ